MGDFIRFLKIFLLSIVICVISIFLGFNASNISILTSSLYVDSFICNIDFSEQVFGVEGKKFVLNISEEYTYIVRNDGEWRMLFRSWKVPLVYSGYSSVRYLEDKEFVNLLNIESDDGIPYIKDIGGYVFTINDLNRSLVEEIGSKAYTNEVGIVSKLNSLQGSEELRYFAKGKYKFKVVYSPHYICKKDSEHSHINITLADEHLYYKGVKIVVRDTKGIIEGVYPHLSGGSMIKKGNEYIITGFSPSDRIVGVEILMKSIPIWGVEEDESNVGAETLLVNYLEISLSILKQIMMYVVLACIIFSPIYALFIYYKYGRESFTVVPRYISYIPNKNEKPWKVNLLFVKNPETTEKEAFFATLWDLERRGLITVLGQSIDLRKALENKDKLDVYEKRVIEVLEKYSQDAKFSFEHLNSLIEKYYNESDEFGLRDIKYDFDSVFKYTYSELSDKMIDKTGAKKLGNDIFFVMGVIVIAYVVVYVLSKIFAGYIYFADLFWIIVGFVVQVVIFSFSSPDIFGKWKGEFYKRRLEWESFGRFLSDFAKMKEVDVSDNIFKEWFVYAIALGVASKFLNNIKKLGIDIPEISNFYSTTVSSFSSSYSTANSHLSSLTGGGFGGGGGSGGGGAGGR